MCIYVLYKWNINRPKVCDDLIEVGNLVPTISVEGFDYVTDGRRGEGSRRDITRAMDLMKVNRVPFGFATCFTTANCDSVYLNNL